MVIRLKRLLRKTTALILALLLAATGLPALTPALADGADFDVELVKARIDLIPDTVGRNDVKKVNLAKTDYDKLTQQQKTQVTNYGKLENALQQVQQLKNDPIRITCVGSSTTEGVGASDMSKYSYPAQLQALLGPDFVITNAGASGTTVVFGAGTNQYYGSAKYNLSMSSNPDMVLMFVGSNDATNDNWYRTDINYPEKFKSCYKALLEGYLNLSTRPTVVMCYPYNVYTGDGRPTIVPNHVIPILNEIAAEYGCPILDLYTPTTWENWCELMPDALHPNDQGYAIVAKAAYDFITDYFSTELKELKAGGQSIELLEGVSDYGVLVTNGQIPQITAVGANDKQKITITQAEGPLPAVAKIRVVSADDEFSQLYTVTFAESEEDIKGHKVAADIARIGNVTLEKEQMINQARSSYDSLPPRQMAVVQNYDVLISAEAKLDEIKEIAAAADAVKNMIEALGEITSRSQKADIKAARAAYEALSAEAKELVTNYDKLLQAVETMYTIDPAFKVEDAIDLIKENNYRYGSKIRAARAMYDALSAEDKANVGNYGKLVAAEAAVKAQYDAYTVTISPANWTNKYSKYPWLNADRVTEADKQATVEAMADEMKYEYVMQDYCLGKTSGVYNLDTGAWGEILSLQTDNNIWNADPTGLRYETDNIWNPWNQGGRYWAMVGVPFVGMAFSQKGYFGLKDFGQIALGNSFVYEGKVYQVYWAGTYWHEDVPLVQGNTNVAINKIDYFPGSSGSADITNNTFRYAYANYSQVNKWQGLTLGIPVGNAVKDGNLTYQEFTGPYGSAWIVNTADRISASSTSSNDSMKQNQAYVIAGELAEVFKSIADTNAERFAITGAPLGNAENGAQRFENGILTASGFKTGEEPVEEPMLGDVDLDGRRTVADIVMIRSAIMGRTELSEQQMRAANVDEDPEGRITVTDIVALRRLIMSEE